MATSSITRNFVVEGESQVRMFADAIEQSYQESLMRKEKQLARFHYINSAEAMDEFMEEWEKAHTNGCEDEQHSLRAMSLLS